MPIDGATWTGRNWIAMTNDWCRTLGIEPPTLDAVAHHREAIFARELMHVAVRR